MGIIVTHHQGDFSGGQVDALFEGQSENPHYKKSLKKCLNFLPTIQGGAVRRPGTYHLEDINIPSGEGFIALIPYTISRTENYVVLLRTDGIFIYGPSQRGPLDHILFAEQQVFGFSNLSQETIASDVSHAVLGRDLYLNVKGSGLIIVRSGLESIPRVVGGEAGSRTGRLSSGTSGFGFEHFFFANRGPWGLLQEAPWIRAGTAAAGPLSFSGSDRRSNHRTYGGASGLFATGTLGQISDSAFGLQLRSASAGMGAYDEGGWFLTPRDRRAVPVVAPGSGGLTQFIDGETFPAGTAIVVDTQESKVVFFHYYAELMNFHGDVVYVDSVLANSKGGRIVVSGTPSALPANPSQVQTDKYNVLMAIINEIITADTGSRAAISGNGSRLICSADTDLSQLAVGGDRFLSFSASDFTHGVDELLVRPAIFLDGYIPHSLRLDTIDYDTNLASDRYRTDFAQDSGYYADFRLADLHFARRANFDATHNPSIWPILSHTEAWDTSPNNRPIPLVTWPMRPTAYGPWPEGRGGGSYPNAVSFFENRLMLLGGKGRNAPVVFGSKTDVYEDFNNRPTAFGDGGIPPLTPSSAFAHDPATAEGSEVLWGVSTSRGLVLGYDFEEFVYNINSDAAPPQPIFRTFGYNGSSGVRPVVAGQAVIFPDSSKVSLREILYYEERSALDSVDLNLYSKFGITDSGFTQLAYMQGPQTIVWGVLNNGDLVGMTYDRGVRKLQVGWHIHRHGNKNASFKSVAVVNWPGQEYGVRDAEAVMALVEYAAIGLEGEDDYIPARIALEVMPGPFQDRAQGQYNFMDGTRFLTDRTMAIPDGQTVVADGYLLDGSHFRDRVLTSPQYDRILHGYKYDSDLELLRPAVPTRNGASLGKIARIHQLPILLKDTNYLKYGTRFDNLSNMLFRESRNPMDAPTRLFSGVKREAIKDSFDYDSFIALRVDQPFPCTILGVSAQLLIEERM